MGKLIRFAAYVGWSVAAAMMDVSNTPFLIGLLALAVVDLSYMCDKIEI